MNEYLLTIYDFGVELATVIRNIDTLYDNFWFVLFYFKIWMSTSNAHNMKLLHPKKYQELLAEPTAEQKALDAIKGGSCVTHSEF